jgi:predicted transcriptional regulator
MNTAKKVVEKFVLNMPDNSSIEDLHYHLYVIEKVRKGMKDIQEGRFVTLEQAKERFKKWIIK